MIDMEKWSSSVTAESIVLTALGSAAYDEGQVTVTVVDSSNTRSSSAQVTISVLPALLPTISLSTSSSQINGGQSLQIIGTISFPASTGGNASWQIVAGTTSRSLSSIALTPISQQFPISSSARIYSMNLAIPPNSLTVGSTYTFGLTAISSYEGKSVTGSIMISINSPPILGSFTISPTSGQELTQSFSFICSEWVDQNLPLSYQFSYMSAAGNKVVLRSLSIVSYASAVLPGGSKANNNTLTTVADIYDSLNANSTSTFGVHVYTASALSSSANNGTALASLVTQSLNPSSWNNVDDIIQGTAIANYLLNQVNCSLPENYCSSRNRNPCATTALTCGSCISSAFIGTMGDSNDPCHSLADENEVTATVNEMSASSKQCGGNCSGHGLCTFSSLITGLAVSTCSAEDASCTASCSCFAGYTLSNNCELSDAEVQQKRALRDQVIAGIQQYVSLQNPSEQSVSSWISSVNDATQNPSELSMSSIVAALNIANNAINVAQSSGYESSSVSTVLTSLDALASAVALSVGRNSTVGSGRRRSLDASNSSSSISGAIMLQSLANYSHLVGGQLLPGQTPATFIQNNFRLHIQSTAVSAVASAVTGQCSNNLSMIVPQSSFESFLGIQQTAVSVPSCPSSNTSTLTLSLISLASSLYGNPNFKSDPLTLSVSAHPCADPSDCNAKIVLQSDNSGIVLISKAVNVTYQCEAGDTGKHNITCPDGRDYLISCSGKAETVVGTCPAVAASPTCNGLFSNAASDIGCEVVSNTETSTTCSCPIIVSALSDSSLRALHVSNVTDTMVSDECEVSYVGMLGAVSSTFQATVLSAGSLNAAELEGSWSVLVTISSLLGAIIIALVVSYYADKATMTKVALEEKIAGSVHTIKAGRKVKVGGVSQQWLSSSSPLQREKKYSNIMILAEQALPQILRSQSLQKRVWNELKRYHRWLGIVYYFSAQFPRPLRVMSLATNVILMLFIQSLTYQFTTGDDGTCEKLETETTCLAPLSSYGTGESKCYWTPSTAGSTTSGTCQFVQPENSIQVVVFVAIFSALVTTPIALCTDWIIHHILSAPSDSPINQASSDSDLVPIVPTMNGNAFGFVPSHLAGPNMLPVAASFSSKKERPLSVEHHFTALVEQEYFELKKELTNYRTRIKTVEQQKEFDELWGLDKDGTTSTWEHQSDDSSQSKILKQLFSRRKKATQLMFSIIKSDLQSLHDKLEKETSAFQLVSSEQWKMKRLLFLFQKDLIPGILGELLDSKDARDNPVMRPVSERMKIAAWLLLGALDSGMLFYIFIFAISQDSHRQAAWGRSFGTWLVLEIVLISSTMVLLMHVLLPSILMKDVMKIQKRLVESISHYYEKIEQQDNTHEKQGVKEEEGFQKAKRKGKKVDDGSSFNAAKYLFLSYRLAERYPELKASKIILQFTTPWPKQSYQHVTDVKANYTDSSTGLSRSISIVAIFLLTNLLSVPLAAQDMIVHMCTTAGVGYTLLLHIQLYQIYPVLVIVPTMFIGLIIHFYYTASKKQDAINEAKLKKIKKEEKSEDVEKEQEEEEDGDSDLIEIVEEGKKQHVAERMRYAREILPPHEAIMEHKTRRQSVLQGFQLSSQLKTIIWKAEKRYPDNGSVLFPNESSPSDDDIAGRLVKDDRHDRDWVNDFSSELTLSEGEDDVSLEIPLSKTISSEVNSSVSLWRDRKNEKHRPNVVNIIGPSEISDVTISKAGKQDPIDDESESWLLEEEEAEEDNDHF